ncbi:hypothetical protein QSI79_23525, partial [Enterobacter asburiae]|uniref:hypothetical protein n=1 Tax=Enterobacter asburiae TaxID=61645 RepID=UPI00287A8509
IADPPFTACHIFAFRNYQLRHLTIPSGIGSYPAAGECKAHHQHILVNSLILDIFGQKRDSFSAANPLLTIMTERCSYYLNSRIALSGNVF